MSEIGNLVKAIAPYFNGNGVMQTFDKTQRIAGMKKLRQDLPRVYGRGWNRREYSAADMAKIAQNMDFSAEARDAAKFLASPAGAARLARLNSRGGRPGDKRFGVKDLEGVNRDLQAERGQLAKNADSVAMQELGEVTRQLNKNFESAVGSIASRLMQSASTRID